MGRTRLNVNLIPKMGLVLNYLRYGKCLLFLLYYYL